MCAGILQTNFLEWFCIFHYGIIIFFDYNNAFNNNENGHKIHPYWILIVLRVNVIFADDLAANVDRSAADIIWIQSTGVYRICRTVQTNTKKIQHMHR